mmetsp:Transcript_95476/g.165858  ORF Transcript_95476/g.165858 Transcript_95476/m.165858 type:complete len:80 (+) Transcript_95476:337-576(+)
MLSAAVISLEAALVRLLDVAALEVAPRLLLPQLPVSCRLSCPSAPSLAERLERVRRPPPVPPASAPSIKETDFLPEDAF